MDKFIVTFCVTIIVLTLILAIKTIYLINTTNINQIIGG